MSHDLSRGDIALAAALYAKAHAPWGWQAKLRSRLAAAYMQGAYDALMIYQTAGQPIANPVHRPFQPGEPHV
jgi:hypothetical protein